MNDSEEFPRSLARFQMPALIAGVVGLIGCLLLAAWWPGQVMRSYLFAWVFWLGLALGSLGMAMVQRLVGGEWGLMVRRPFESAALTLPLMGLLLVPIFLGRQQLYPWAQPNLVATDLVLHFKTPYLNISAIVIRSIVYFAIWIALALLITTWSTWQDRDDKPSRRARLMRLCAGGIVLYVLSMTFAGIDWIMSREPHWHSTVYGFIVVVGQGLSAFAFATVIVTCAVRSQPLVGVVRGKHLNDLGSLLLTLVILFAYMAFAQYLINWCGNKQDEITWYVPRSSGGWRWLALAVIVFHFFVPLLLLLSRFVKQQARFLGAIAGMLLLFRLADVFWMIAPSGTASHPAFGVYWSDLLAPVGIGGVWIAVFLWILKRRHMLPSAAYNLQETPGHGAHP